MVHDYAVGDQILICTGFLFQRLDGPFLYLNEIIQTCADGIVHIQCGITAQRINICWLIM